MHFRGLIALAALAVASPAYAWNNYGHMEVAAVAWAHMERPIQQKASALIKLNPLYKEWIKGVPAKDRDEVAFVIAATWPDIIKRDDDYHNDGSDGGDRPPNSPKASQNIGYDDMLRHKYWHFVDTPFSPDGTPTVQAAKPNAQTQIAAFRAKLADHSASEDVRSYDLVWLLHLVGDVHQPLHATSRFVASNPKNRHGEKTDNGGNLVKIHCTKCQSATNLHAFWDDALGPSKVTAQTVIEAATELAAPDPAQAAIADEKDWIRESFELAKKDVYVSPIGVTAETFEITKVYQDNAVKVAKDRIALAGVRLANLLTEALK